MKMRRIVSLLLSIAVVIILAIPITVNAATSNAPNRVINLSLLYVQSTEAW